MWTLSLSVDLGWDHLWDPCRCGVGHVPPRWSLASSSQGYSLSTVGFNWKHRDQMSSRQTPAAVGHERDCRAVIHLVEHIPVGFLCLWHQVCFRYAWGN